jgi:hypothetical protein
VHGGEQSPCKKAFQTEKISKIPHDFTEINSLHILLDDRKALDDK